MALHLHRATRTDELAEGLARVLATPLPDPFAAELVVVPAKGIERWLSQRLSHWLGAGSAADGVCAAVQFRSPGSLIAELLGILDDDPWRPDALAWRVLGAVDTHLGEPWARPLARHLGAGREGEELELRQGRRYALARR
ncbi:MAG: exodeoxyribonuclease V subunit gamma, partial [Nocardioides sp.]